jgi:polyhydroxybutyrate depolymerase
MRRLLFVAIALLVSGLSCSPSDRAPLATASLEAGTLEHDGLQRTFWVYAPDTLASPAPLVLALHGGGGTGKGMCSMAGGLMTVAEDHGFLLVCPDGVERHWNDGRGIDDWRAHAEQIDDVGFLAALVDHLSRQWAIDRGAIFVTGISNGGLMSYRMACERADLVRAIAAVTASLPEALACEPSEPISILIVNGTQDPLVPYDGGEITVLRRTLGRVLSTEDTYRFWAEFDKCPGPAAVTDEPDVDPGDGTEVQRAVLDPCADGTRVELYTIFGGGHTWPGGPQYLPAWIVGRVSRDLNASEAIWESFSRSKGS